MSRFVANENSKIQSFSVEKSYIRTASVSFEEVDCTDKGVSVEYVYLDLLFSWTSVRNAGNYKAFSCLTK